MFGVVVIALATALGGGTLRDLLLDRDIFWISDQTYLVAAMVAGMLTFFAARHLHLPAKRFLLPDAVGLALFTVLGTQKALLFGTSWLVAVTMGVITGVAGGVVRDVLCNEVPLVFRGELYATAALAGASLLILLNVLSIDAKVAALAVMITIFAVRLAGIYWHITLPTFARR